MIIKNVICSTCGGTGKYYVWKAGCIDDKAGLMSKEECVCITCKGKGRRNIMGDEFNKCYFCCYYDEFDGCESVGCYNKNGYKANKNRIIEKAKEKGISVADVIALINME